MTTKQTPLTAHLPKEAGTAGGLSVLPNGSPADQSLEALFDGLASYSDPASWGSNEVTQITRKGTGQ